MTAAMPPTPTDSISSKWPSFRPIRLSRCCTSGEARSRAEVMTVGVSSIAGSCGMT
jgi:hypothetical protein